MSAKKSKKGLVQRIDNAILDLHIRIGDVVEKRGGNRKGITCISKAAGWLGLASANYFERASLISSQRKPESTQGYAPEKSTSP